MSCLSGASSLPLLGLPALAGQSDIARYGAGASTLGAYRAGRESQGRGGLRER